MGDGQPDKVASLVLIDTGILVGYRWHYLARIWRAPVVDEIFQATTTRAGFRLLLKHGNPRGLPREFVDRMYNDYDRGTKRAILKLYRATSKPGQRAVELSQALRPLKLPALIVWGRHDPYLTSATPMRSASGRRSWTRKWWCWRIVAIGRSPITRRR